MRGSFIALTTATVLAMPAAPLAAQPPWAQPRFVPRAQPAPLSPVYRLVAAGSNDHVYSIDANEVNVLAQQGSHTYEGVVFQLFSTPGPGLQPLYRYVTGN